MGMFNVKTNSRFSLSLVYNYPKMFISEFVSRFPNKAVLVEIDPLLLPFINSTDRSTTRIVNLNLYRLIYLIGTIQSRRFSPTTRQKFSDFSALLERIQFQTPELRIKIEETRARLGAEELTQMSEDFGVGISAEIASTLFPLDISTVQKIKTTGTRPDWEGQTNSGLIMIVEAKGSINQTTADRQLIDGRSQKASAFGDIKIVSSTLLKENEISVTRLVDPPIGPDDTDPQLQRKILRAGHYASVFNFLGHPALSKYFSQMQKRLSQTITVEEQTLKNLIYIELRDDYNHVTFQDKTFTGTFYHIKAEKYLYIGVDIQLISYQGFLNFQDYETDINVTINSNHFILFRDGILIIEIERILEFALIVNIDNIQNYQEKTGLRDIDKMNGISFETYIKYLLEKNDFELESETNEIDSGIDLIARYRNQVYFIQLLLTTNAQTIRQRLSRLSRQAADNLPIKFVLITNSPLPSTLIQTQRIISDSIILIGREELKAITKNTMMLGEMLI